MVFELETSKGIEGGCSFIAFIGQLKLKEIRKAPWLVWFSGLSASLQSKGSLVGSPIRAHAWASAQDPRVCERHPHIAVSLPLFLLSSSSL